MIGDKSVAIHFAHRPFGLEADRPDEAAKVRPAAHQRTPFGAFQDERVKNRENSFLNKVDFRKKGFNSS